MRQSPREPTPARRTTHALPRTGGSGILPTRLQSALAATSLLLLAACGSTTPQPFPTVQSASVAAPSTARASAQPSGALPSSAQPSGAQPSSALPTAERPAIQVTEPGAFIHLEALQRIADENGGNRAARSAGYEASVEYVVSTLRADGYDVSTPTYAGSDGQDSPDVTLRNVIAQTRSGDPESIVMIGAHLDSVEEGPGIVDDGSGVAVLLEIAHQLGAAASIRNGVRFAFFGSEEDGALGSRGYVNSLSTDERRKIWLYLNVDMVASPNAGYFVQGGHGDDESASGPPGSAAVARVLADQLTITGVTPEIIEFVGDDEAPFVEADIPAAGAENGDRQEKNEEQALAWGGQAGAVYDECYHQACDRLDNVNRVVLDHHLHAIAGTLAHFAISSERPSG